MKLDEIRTLKWQIVATALLFVGCIPIAAAVIWQRERFEQHMFEKYTANFAKFPESLQKLIQDAETPAPDEKLLQRIATLSPEMKHQLYEDWMLRRDPARPHVPASLVAADAAWFLKRAEQSVVCGSEEQRELALEFLVLSRSDQTPAIFDRLVAWGELRQRPEIVEQVERKKFSAKR